MTIHRELVLKDTLINAFLEAKHLLVINNYWLLIKLCSEDINEDICIALQWRHNGRNSLKTPVLRLFTQPFIQTQIKENIKARRHWPLCGEFTGDRWIARTNGQ